VGEFRGALQVQAERTPAPRLQTILDRERPQAHHALRWAAAAVLVVTLGSIPVYREAQQRERKEQERADAQLLKQINTSLSRSVPRAFGALAAGGQQ
jgi:hypothetical protein